jgi:hypothetical protein
MQVPGRGEVWIVDLGLAAKVRRCLVVLDRQKSFRNSARHTHQWPASGFVAKGDTHGQPRVENPGIRRDPNRLHPNGMPHAEPRRQARARRLHVPSADIPAAA